MPYGADGPSSKDPKLRKGGKLQICTLQSTLLDKLDKSHFCLQQDKNRLDHVVLYEANAYYEALNSTLNSCFDESYLRSSSPLVLSIFMLPNGINDRENIHIFL